MFIDITNIMCAVSNGMNYKSEPVRVLPESSCELTVKF